MSADAHAVAVDVVIGALVASLHEKGIIDKFVFLQEFEKVQSEIDDEEVADAIGRLCYSMKTALPCGFEGVSERAEAK